MSKLLQHEVDTRPQKLGWSPGNYSNICHECGKTFLGDKRAFHCAPCVYGEKPKLNRFRPESRRYYEAHWTIYLQSRKPGHIITLDGTPLDDSCSKEELLGAIIELADPGHMKRYAFEETT